MPAAERGQYMARKDHDLEHGLKVEEQRRRIKRNMKRLQQRQHQGPQAQRHYLRASIRDADRKKGF